MAAPARGSALFLAAVVVLPVLLATGAPVSAAPAPYACAQEDGSGAGQRFPCYWDAAARGNHHGASFVLTGA